MKFICTTDNSRPFGQRLGVGKNDFRCGFWYEALSLENSKHEAVVIVAIAPG